MTLAARRFLSTINTQYSDEYEENKGGKQHDTALRRSRGRE